MLKLYCQRCGGLNTYVSEKPNFCQKCGQSIGGKIPNQSAVANENLIDENMDEEDTDDEQGLRQLDFNLQGLAFDFDPGRTNTDTVGNLVNTLSEDEAKKLNDREGMPAAPKYTAEDFQKEAGNSRDVNNEGST